MSFFDRLLLTVYVLVTGALLVSALGSFFNRRALLDSLIHWQPNYVDSQILLVLTLALLLAGARLFYIALPVVQKKAVVQQVALGRLRIALPAIENLVVRIGLGYSPVIRAVKAKVLAHKDGIGLSINLSVTPEAQVPDLVEGLQKHLQEQLQHTLGITVQDIQVGVESITASKPKVE
ncbi:MAG: alkaline shock response membrane anchor protein AmaP [Bacillota bacterium]